MDNEKLDKIQSDIAGLRTDLQVHIAYHKSNDRTITDLKKAVFGNGEPGLKQRVQTLQESHHSIMNWPFAFTVLGAIVAILRIVGKI